MNKADGFSLQSSRSPSESDQEQTSFWNNLSTAVRNTAQYASVEFDRLFETMGFKQHPHSLTEEQEQQSIDTTLPSPTTTRRQQNLTSRYFSTPSYSSTSQKQYNHKSSQQSFVSSPSSSAVTKDCRKRSFRHDNVDTLDHMMLERAEKLRKINQVEAMLRELKEEALMEGYNHQHSTSNNTNNVINSNSSSTSCSTITSPAKIATTRTIARQPRISTESTSDEYRPNRNQQGRMSHLEQRIESIQAQVAELVSSTNTTLIPSSFTLPSSPISRPTMTAATTTTTVKPPKPTITRQQHIPIPPPPPAPAPALVPLLNHNKLSSRLPIIKTNDEPEIPLPSPPPPSAQSPIRHRRNDSTDATCGIPVRRYQKGVKVLPSTPVTRPPRITPPMNKVPSDIHKSSMREIVLQIPNVKLRRTDMLEGPDGSRKPNPFWVEIYEPKRRFKRSRPSTARDNDQQQSGTIGSGPAFKRQHA